MRPVTCTLDNVTASLALEADSVTSVRQATGETPGESALPATATLLESLEMALNMIKFSFINNKSIFGSAILIQLIPNSFGIVFLSSIFNSSETFKLIPEIAILMQCPFIVSL